jgi:hypothetical protein
MMSMTWALAVVVSGIGSGFTAIAIAVRSSRPAGERVQAPPPTALRCTMCGVDWPHDLRHYGRCPACLAATDVIACGAFQPVDAHEARSIRLHHEFERFYAARERSDGA